MHSLTTTEVVDLMQTVASLEGTVTKEKLDKLVKEAMNGDLVDDLDNEPGASVTVQFASGG